MRTIPQDGLIRYFWFFKGERVLISSPKGLAEVLVSKSYQFMRPGTAARALLPIMGEGILLNEGEVHKVQRCNLMPAFAFRHVNNLYPVFWQKAGEVVYAMVTLADEEGLVAELDVLGWANRCTLDIIGVAGMGVDFGSTQDPTNPLAETYRSLLRSGNHSRLLLALGDERLREWGELDVRFELTACLRGLRVRARVLS